MAKGFMNIEHVARARDEAWANIDMCKSNSL